MLQRFSGSEGERRLIDSLQRQQIVRGDPLLAQEFAATCEVSEFSPGTILMRQGASDTDVYLVLSGRVGVEIDGVEIAIRNAGMHVGEMSALDPSAVRHATVRAIEPTIVARVSEPDLNALAESQPQVWRNLAIVMAERLRERSRYIRVPNARPHLFIGSSAEMLPVAQEIQAGLSRDDMSVVVWTDGIFRASQYAISGLLEEADRSDFGIIVFGPDDVLISRGNEMSVPRDNAIFELGLFIGAVGKDRTFIVKPRGSDIHLPSDLLGLTPVEYEAQTESNIEARLGPACSAIRKLVQQHGVR